MVAFAIRNLAADPSKTLGGKWKSESGLFATWF